MSQRLTRQYLESLQRAGVTHLPLVSPVAQVASAPPEMPKPPVEKSEPAKAKPTVQPERAAPPVVKPEPTPTPAPVAAPVVPVPIELPKLAADATSDERQAVLTSIAARVAACVKCQELAGSRKQTVFGVGNPNADIMFIGEAPGADEDRLGEPFVGKAGQLLDKIIEACNLKREEIYICNILRCRPPGNRDPSPEEAANCREFLDGQIAAVRPKYIVCWGSVAAHNLLSQTTSVGRMRGKFYSYGDAKVACTYHPSYLLRNPSAKKQVWEDMKFVFADMGVTL